MTINQGDIYWVVLPHQADEDRRIAHPHVVIQADALNHDDAVATVVVCAVTTNAKKMSYPGNVLLDVGEGNLTRPSIVEVAKVITLDKNALGDYIGTLSAERVQQILAGMRFVKRSFFDR